MVRTKADSSARKAVAAKAPRKVLGNAGGGGGGGAGGSMMSPKAGKYAGGNPVCDRPTPEWQRGISKFFTVPEPRSNVDKENESPSKNAEAADEDMEIGEPSSASGSSKSGAASATVTSAEEPQSEDTPEEASATGGSSGSSASGSSSSFKPARNGVIDDSDED